MAFRKKPPLDPEEKAREVLFKHLTLKQKVAYLEGTGVRFKGTNGGTYTYSGSYFYREAPGVPLGMPLCLIFPETLPPADQVLAVKLMVETDELAFRHYIHQ